MKWFDKKKVDYSIYLCTDRKLMSTDTLEEAVLQAIKGGVTVIQLREKDCSSRDFYETAVSIHKITEKYHVPLIINDRVDIALAVDAEGVHVGQSDLPADVVRKIIGKDKIIGVSAGNLTYAKKALEDGADYIGVGAMYATNTKQDAKPTTKEELRKIVAQIPLKTVVIGGINENTIPDFRGIDIDGLAIVSAIIAKPDIEQATREIKKQFLSLKEE